jgi:hypothetical protein
VQKFWQRRFALKLMVLARAPGIWVRFARIARGEALQLKSMNNIALARVAGASTPRLPVCHVFSGVSNTLIVSSHPPGRLGNSGRIYPELAGSRGAPADPGVGFDGRPRVEIPGGGLVDFYDAGGGHLANGSFTQSIWGLAAGFFGPETAPAGQRLTEGLGAGC